VGDRTLVSWLDECRAIAAAVREVLDDLPAGGARAEVLGVGAGGDETTAVDAAAERAVLDRLGAVHAGGEQFVVVSEELGVRAFGDSPRWWVVVDPIDGSLNAKRGIPFFSLSIAVAEGSRLGDVVLAFVRDLAGAEEWTAVRGQGAALCGTALERPQPPTALEVVELSGTSARLVADQAARLREHVEKLRVMGSLALSLCHLAAGRNDGVVSLRAIRSVDVAAAQLLVREQGMAIGLPQAEPFALAELDLGRRSRIVAAQRAEHYELLAGLLGPAPA
jgi:myo-inositol-1(or 4)-monophosphatase